MYLHIEQAACFAQAQSDVLTFYKKTCPKGARELPNALASIASCCLGGLEKQEKVGEGPAALPGLTLEECVKHFDPAYSKMEQLMIAGTSGNDCVRLAVPDYFPEIVRNVSTMSCLAFPSKQLCNKQMQGSRFSATQNVPTKSKSACWTSCIEGAITRCAPVRR